MLKIVNLESGYGRLKVLRKVSLHVNPGEIVTIIGANGAGKTTLLKTISGLVKATSGEVVFDKRDITNLATERIVSCGCVLVPEGRQVFSTMTVKENLLLGAYLRFKKAGSKRVNEEMERIYNIFPKLKERHKQLAGTLSGGEQQMLAIARALMSDPKLIMMDEPSMGLAPVIVKEILNIISQLRQQGKTVLLVEQNAKMALAVSDRGYVLETGRIVLQGSSEELLENRDVQRAYLGRDLDAEIRL
ncbi:MAG: ABC transporter ATP-binding protein [Nitrospirae bacterium]|nr:ABC transporter ATP-binding protein [Nitrospirota bacterium]